MQAVLQGLYAHGRSLFDVGASIDEHMQVEAEAATARPDPARAERLGGMAEAVAALLAKYGPPQGQAAGSGSAGPSSSAE